MCCFWGSDFDPHQSLYCILAWLAAWVCRKTKAIDRFEREVKLAGRPKENVEWKQPKTPPTSPNTEYWHQKTLQAREYDAVRKENQKRTKGKKKESITVYTVRKEKKKKEKQDKKKTNMYHCLHCALQSFLLPPEGESAGKPLTYCGHLFLYQWLIQKNSWIIFPSTLLFLAVKIVLVRRGSDGSPATSTSSSPGPSHSSCPKVTSPQKCYESLA